MTTLKERLSNSGLRKYFSFFEFYYYVMKKNPKRFDLAHGNTINYLTVLMTPLVLWLIVMNWFLITGSGFALIAFITFGIALILNLIFTHSVLNEAREIEREKYRKKREEEEYARRVEETLRRQRERDEEIIRRREEEIKRAEYYERVKRAERADRAEQHRRKLANTEHQLIQLYSVLGIEPTTDINVIKKAYRQKAKQHHPDMGGDELSFTNVNKAYEIILKYIEKNSNI